MTQDEILTMAENAELVVSKHSVWTPEKKDFTFMGHTVEGDLANLMQFAALVAFAERERTWFGLTDEEIRSIAKPPDDIEIPMTGRMWIFVGDLMDKLKEKNT